MHEISSRFTSDSHVSGGGDKDSDFVGLWWIAEVYAVFCVFI